MKTAFAYWDGRLAPVFDTARQIQLVHVEGGKILAEMPVVLPGTHLPRRLARLAELGVGQLVCGAVSRQCQEMLAGHGIEVVSFLAGDLREVIDAWMQGALLSERFAMPGCLPPRRRADGAPRQADLHCGQIGACCTCLHPDCQWD